MSTRIYLVFGDLHGRVLPAFRLATLWARDHGKQLDGLLQVGDLGYFPDPSRLDKATRRHAEKDPTELGALEIVAPSLDADRVFGEEGHVVHGRQSRGLSGAQVSGIRRRVCGRCLPARLVLE
jgi:hypothetical protein